MSAVEEAFIDGLDDVFGNDAARQQHQRDKEEAERRKMMRKQMNPFGRMAHEFMRMGQMRLTAEETAGFMGSRLNEHDMSDDSRMELDAKAEHAEALRFSGDNERLAEAMEKNNQLMQQMLNQMQGGGNAGRRGRSGRGSAGSENDGPKPSGSPTSIRDMLERQASDLGDDIRDNGPDGTGKDGPEY